MAIQMRRGEYKDLNTEKLLPAEWAVVLSGDPKAKDGRAAYLCFKAGDVKRMATYEDMEENIEEAVGVIAEKAAEKAASTVTEKAEEKINDATKRAYQSASKAEEAAEKVDDGLGAYQEKLNNTVKEYDKRLDAGITECKNILNSVSENFKQSVDFNAEQGSYWYVNSNRTITKYGPSSEYIAYTNTVIPVTEGEVYEVHCARSADSYYVPGPVIAVSSATNSEADGTIAIFENPTDGNDQYVLTVPAGAKYLLVNHVVKAYSGIDMEIYKRNSLEDVVMGAVKGMFSGAAAHNAIYRGKYLGDTVTDAQAAAIVDGNFNDLYVGDYWTIGGVNYRIADLNYWKGIGNGTKCTTNHVVIVPDTILNTGKMNNTATVSGGYINSLMKSKTLNTLAENLPDTLKNRLLTHDTYIFGYWMRSSVDLLSERMIYGCKVLSNETKFSEVRQLNLFRMDTERIVLDEHYWLRDVVSNTNFAVVNKNGFTDTASANGTFGIRPVFAIHGGLEKGESK